MRRLIDTVSCESESENGAYVPWHPGNTSYRLNIRDAHERPEDMKEAAVMMTGSSWTRVQQAHAILSTRPRGLTRTLRLVRNYGVPDQRPAACGDVIPVFTFQMLAGELLTVFGDGEQTHDFVNVDDIAAAEAALGFVPSAAIEGGLAEYAGWTRDEPQRA